MRFKTAREKKKKRPAELAITQLVYNSVNVDKGYIDIHDDTSLQFSSINKGKKSPLN